jgi:hypothetical protein
MNARLRLILATWIPAIRLYINVNLAYPQIIERHCVAENTYEGSVQEERE